MIRTTLDEASRRLEQLIDAALQGEEVIITAPNSDGERVVKLVATATEPLPRRKAGSARGLIHAQDDFDDPLPDFDEYR
jgi:antitoxin (DNA-binding transcriptional repressor) of toxin-antitoxin stability system